jgi:hypothetical protein
LPLQIVAVGQDWPHGEGPFGDWLYKFSDALDAKGIHHDGTEEEGELQAHKHGHFVAKLALANDDKQLGEARKWVRDLLGIGTGAGKIAGKVQFKLITAASGGIEGIREYICKDSDQQEASQPLVSELILMHHVPSSVTTQVMTDNMVDNAQAGRFRWVTNRGTAWAQISAWGAEWRRKHPRTYGLGGKLIKKGQLMQQAYYHAGCYPGALLDMLPMVLSFTRVLQPFFAALVLWYPAAPLLCSAPAPDICTHLAPPTCSVPPSSALAHAGLASSRAKGRAVQARPVGGVRRHHQARPGQPAAVRPRLEGPNRLARAGQ